MAACWALREKYWLWSFKVPLEAQSCLPFWHIVKKQMLQIRTYCSSGGEISAFDSWAPQLCPVPLSDKLTLSAFSFLLLFILPQSASAKKQSQVKTTLIFFDLASLFVIWSLPSQLFWRMCHFPGCSSKGQYVRTGKTWEGFPWFWMLYNHSGSDLAPVQHTFQ